MEAKIRAFHRMVLLVLGYTVVVSLMTIGAAEVWNRWKLAEGVRPFLQRVAYDWAPSEERRK